MRYPKAFIQKGAPSTVVVENNISWEETGRIKPSSLDNGDDPERLALFTTLQVAYLACAKAKFLLQPVCPHSHKIELVDLCRKRQEEDNRNHQDDRHEYDPKLPPRQPNDLPGTALWSPPSSNISVTHEIGGLTGPFSGERCQPPCWAATMLRPLLLDHYLVLIEPEFPVLVVWA